MKDKILIVILGFIFTAVFSWPFITKLPAFSYDRGDYQLTGGALSYNEYSIRTGRIFNRQEYFNGYQFYPQPDTLVYSDLRLVPSLIYSPIYWLTHNFIFSVNTTTFLTFVLSFISGFYFLYFFTKHKLASIVGALVFTFNPLTYSRFPEHFELLNKYFLPLVFLFAFKFFTKPNFKNAVFFFLFLTLNAFSATYFQLFSFLILPVFALPFVVQNFRQKHFEYFGNLIKFSLVFIIFIPVFWYFDSAYTNFSSLENSRRTITETSFLSARLIDYFASTPNNFLYGPFVKSIEEFRAPLDLQGIYGNFNYQEHTLFLNIIPMVLFILGAGAWYQRFKRKELPKTEKTLFVSFSVVLVSTFLLSFGPYFEGWNLNESSFPLPYYLLYKFIPFLEGIRAPTRILFVFYLPFSLFTAYGAIKLLRSGKRKTMIIFGVILALLWLENFTPEPQGKSYDTQSAVTPQIESRIAKLEFLQDKNTLHLPVIAPSGDIESIYLPWAAETHERIVNGNRGSFLSGEQGAFLKELSEKLDEDEIKKLLALKVNYIVFHKDLLGKDFGVYGKWQNLYQKGEIYEDKEIMVVDLSKYNLAFTICDFNKDFDVSAKQAQIREGGQTFYVVELKNKSDCYYPAIYRDKYKEVDFYINLIKHMALIKLPPVIEPNQTLTFAEVYNNLRWK